MDRSRAESSKVQGGAARERSVTTHRVLVVPRVLRLAEVKIACSCAELVRRTNREREREQKTVRTLEAGGDESDEPVSYTHLTLPTIYSV